MGVEPGVRQPLRKLSGTETAASRTTTTPVLTAPSVHEVAGWRRRLPIATAAPASTGATSSHATTSSQRRASVQSGNAAASTATSTAAVPTAYSQKRPRAAVVTRSPIVMSCSCAIERTHWRERYGNQSLPTGRIGSSLRIVDRAAAWGPQGAIEPDGGRRDSGHHRNGSSIKSHRAT